MLTDSVDTLFRKKQYRFSKKKGVYIFLDNLIKFKLIKFIQIVIASSKTFERPGNKPSWFILRMVRIAERISKIPRVYGDATDSFIVSKKKRKLGNRGQLP